MLTEIEEEEEEIIDLTDYADWTDETHSKSAELNYDVVFNQSEVLRFDIKIRSNDWSDMQSDLSSILGSNGGRPGGGADVSSDLMWVRVLLNLTTPNGTMLAYVTKEIPVCVQLISRVIKNFRLNSISMNLKRIIRI